MPSELTHSSRPLPALTPAPLPAYLTVAEDRKKMALTKETRVSLMMWAATTFASLVIGLAGGGYIAGQWRGSVDEKIKAYDDKLATLKEHNALMERVHNDRVSDLRTDLARIDTNTSMLLAYIQSVQTKAIEFGLKLPPTPRLKSRAEVGLKELDDNEETQKPH